MVLTFPLCYIPSSQMHRWLVKCRSGLGHSILKWSQKILPIPCGAGPRFNIKMSSYQDRKSHCGDKTISRPSYLHNGISYPGKMTSLYWIGAQILFLLHVSSGNTRVNACNDLCWSQYSTNSFHIYSAVWYKTKFGSQNLATNFGVFFMIYEMFSQICSTWL